MRKYLKWLSWRRAYCYMARQEGTPESVAMGAALGLFVGFIMPVGGQLAVAIPLAFLLKANKALAIIGTMVTNPYTIVFIYPFQCWLGSLLLGSPLDFKELELRFQGFLASPSWSGLTGLGSELLWPFLLGGAALALAFSVPAYYLARYAVRLRRRRKAERLAARRRRRSGETAA